MAESTEPVWLSWPLGTRVVVRRRLAAGGYSDAVGPLVWSDEDGVTVETRRHGLVEIPAGDIAIGKIVPPPRKRPIRRPLPSSDDTEPESR